MTPKEAVQVVKARRVLASGEGREVRMRCGILLHEMADALGVSVPTVSKWERGERVPKSDHALAYLSLLNELVRASKTEIGMWA